MSMEPGWKQRTRATSQLQRRVGERKPRERFLIVCEGETEMSYFEAIRRELRLSTTEVHVCGKTCGSAPISMVDHAIELKKHEKEMPYDHVWCVSDRDRHATLEKAVDKAARHQVHLALSIPCFEIWILLHFRSGGKPYEGADALIRDLRKCLPGYTKGKVPFDILWERRSIALQHAEHLAASRDQPRQNPSTNVHKLVRALIGCE